MEPSEDILDIGSTSTNNSVQQQHPFPSVDANFIPPPLIPVDRQQQPLPELPPSLELNLDYYFENGRFLGGCLSCPKNIEMARIWNATTLYTMYRKIRYAMYVANKLVSTHSYSHTVSKCDKCEK